ncbi:odorant receptor 108-1 [Melanotaenia boesemani]|uniref:odorant receptor 108-1 n=1 Tax=Melanotaenia boesemani TaxID=1250792 RepID=UPI001C048937|nr:odorant receptor 108-1 [Melanotaenia boesemani]
MGSAGKYIFHCTQVRFAVICLLLLDAASNRTAAKQRKKNIRNILKVKAIFQPRPWRLTMPFLRTVYNSSLIIHPPGFYIVAFESLPLISVYIIFLAFVYVVTVLFNCLLIYIIIFNHCLHTPKFLAVVNLAVTDLFLNTCIIPSMIKVFLIKDNFIPFNLCLVQMYVYYVLISLESIALTILAYDRLIAICFPLRHNSINTVRRMCCIVSITWCFVLVTIAFTTSIMTRLSFCRSVRVFSYFCDYAPVFRLACNDYSMQWFAASFLSVSLLGGPFIFILLTYISILVTVYKMKSVESRLKALATCVEHIILVVLFYIPIFVIFTIGFFFGAINPDQRVLSLSLSSCIPPCVNPIVYSLKTREIQIRALKLFRKDKINAIQSL